MGLLGSIFGFVTRLICGPPSQEQQPPPQQQVRPAAPPQRPQQQQPSFENEEPIQSYYISIQPPAKPQRRTGHAASATQRFGQNQVNQQNEYYKSLRDRATEEGDAMARAFQESHDAYAGGNGALAKELSNKGKQHQAEMEKLNKEASEWIFTENNKDSGPNEIDLHGLYVKEAIAFTERSVQEARTQGDSELHLIVGKGLHSRNGAKIKPAIEDLMRKYSLVAEVDPSNAGVLVVSLDGHKHGGRVMQPGDIARGIEQENEGCVVM